MQWHVQYIFSFGDCVKDMNLSLFVDCMTDVRQSLAAPKTAGKEGSSSLNELLGNMQSSILEQIKSVLGNLQVMKGKILICQ